MRFTYNLILLLLLPFISNAQNEAYIKYEINVVSDDEEAEMMKVMMNGSTLEIAYSNNKSWLQNTMGTMMTIKAETDLKTNKMLMFMSGVAGKMAFEGSLDEFEEEEEEEEKTDFKLLEETKTILGYECKKAIVTDKEGNEAIYWYTEKFKTPGGVQQISDVIPGLALEMTVKQGGIDLTYTAIEVKEKININDYKVIVPEDVEIQPLKALEEMGGF